jgi:predicted branched-subunit amino acid permease
VRQATEPQSGTPQGELTPVARERDDVLAGIRAMAPMLVAYAPFGLLVGAAVAGSESPVAAWLSTWTIYGGAAHLAVLDVLHAGTGALGAALVGLLVNARMVAYSVSLAPHWRRTSLVSKLGAAAMLTDATWGLARDRDSATDAARRRFYFGAGATLWLGWPSLVSLGVVLGGWVRDVPAVGLLPCLTLGSLAVRQVVTRPAAAAAVVAACAAVLTFSVADGLALAVCAVAGATAAALVHRRSR